MIKDKLELKIQYLFLFLAFVLVVLLVYSFSYINTTKKTTDIKKLKVSTDKKYEDKYKKYDINTPIAKKEITIPKLRQKKVEDIKEDKRLAYEKKILARPNFPYNISLKSDIGFDLKKSSISRYIPLQISLRQDEKIEHISMSLDEHYERYINDMYIELFLKKDKDKKFKCYLDFMPSFEVGSIYEIGIDINNFDMSCYLIDIKEDKNRKQIDVLLKETFKLNKNK